MQLSEDMDGPVKSRGTRQGLKQAKTTLLQKHDGKRREKTILYIYYIFLYAVDVYNKWYTHILQHIHTYTCIYICCITYTYICNICCNRHHRWRNDVYMWVILRKRVILPKSSFSCFPFRLLYTKLSSEWYSDLCCGFSDSKIPTLKVMLKEYTTLRKHWMRFYFRPVAHGQCLKKETCHT